MSGPRLVRAPRGTTLNCKNWQIEAAYRMLQNNLDPEVAERRIWWFMADAGRQHAIGKHLTPS
jgi:hypothetical protein